MYERSTINAPSVICEKYFVHFMVFFFIFVVQDSQRMEKKGGSQVTVRAEREE